jgi:adenosyl cobinamide kinase/adenosyl cobinamide phosphate guanylyltransferase
MMKDGFVFVVGGARSGKSTFAEQLGRRWTGPVTFVATAEAFDSDMANRIEMHQASRPNNWSTLENPLHPAEAVKSIPKNHFVIIDCLTVWVGNMMHRGATEAQILVNAQELVEVLVNHGSPSVVVSNEVGLGVHPETSLGREYRDTLGRVNSLVAYRAHRTLFMSSGQAFLLQDPMGLV